MDKSRTTGAAFLLLLVLASCKSQPGIGIPPGNEKSNQLPVGGGCDGCELMFEGMPEQIDAVDTSAGWREAGQKLKVTGIVYQVDGKSPAADIILYYWQTDNNGYYSADSNTLASARRHGHIRGWMKTGSDGRYTLYTIRPAPYPNETMPAHIHISIKEPDIATEYYIDELVFDDDPFLTNEKRLKLENRGGSGILRTVLHDGMQVAEHNIIAGLNIPDYPPQHPR